MSKLKKWLIWAKKKISNAITLLNLGGTRIITENVLLLRDGKSAFGVSKVYYLVLWLQIF